MLVLREKLESDSSIVCWFCKKLILCMFPSHQGGVTIILIVALHIILDQQSISVNLIRIVWNGRRLLLRFAPLPCTVYLVYIKLAEIGNRTVTRPTFSWVLLENAKVSSFYSPKTGPIEKRDTQTDGRTDGHTDEQTSNFGDPLHKRP